MSLPAEEGRAIRVPCSKHHVPISAWLGGAGYVLLGDLYHTSRENTAVQSAAIGSMYWATELVPGRCFMHR